MAYWVYILASRRNGTLYVGMTGDPIRRVYEHRTGAIPGFTRKYGTTTLVYAEPHEDVDVAAIRERRIKRWRRKWKLDLIERGNPDWCDLYDTLNA